MPVLTKALRDAVQDSVTRAIIARDIARAAASYVRARDLPGLMRVTPEELADESRAGAETIIARLQAHIRGDQASLRAGHWTAFDRPTLARRIAVAGEELRLACMEEQRDAAE